MVLAENALGPNFETFHVTRFKLPNIQKSVALLTSAGSDR
jgi:hypothetical protein